MPGPSDPNSYGFFGQGYWGRKVFWEKIPTQHRMLDTDGRLESQMRAFGDECESFLQQIALLPRQREPYEVRARIGQDEWFYFTEAFTYDDPYWGRVVRLVGEKDYDQMPNHDEDDIPTSDEDELAAWWAWWPYAPISKIARWWVGTWDQVPYKVVRVRTRSFDWPDVPYSSATSQANEVWVAGGDLRIFFDYITDGVVWRDDWTQIGEGDGSSSPDVEFPNTPVRIESNTTGAAPWLTANARLRVRLDLLIGGTDFDLYDVPDGAYPETGNLYPESGTPGQIDTTTSFGTINYQTGQILIDLAAAGDFSIPGEPIVAKWYVRGYYLPFYPPRIIDRLARDFGFDNDKNDPEDVQRSTIANITKYHGLKSTQDSYRIRGEISLFNVYARALWAVCDESLWGSLSVSHRFSYHGELYTDVDPRYIRFDDISGDEELWDPDTAMWETVVDNAVMYEDTSADGYSIGLAYGLDVAQGYYAPVAPDPHPSSGVQRDPAGVVSTTLLTDPEAASYGFLAGYRVVVRMMRCQEYAFNWSKGPFGLTEYDKAESVPPALEDSVFWIDDVETPWTRTSHNWEAAKAYIIGDHVYSTAGDGYECTTAGTSGGVEPTWDTDIGDTTADGTVVWTRVFEPPRAAEDVGEWTVIIGVGKDEDGNPYPGPTVGHGDIIAVDSPGKKFTLAGDLTDAIGPGDTVIVIRSTGNDGTYTVATSTLVGSDTEVVVNQLVSSVVADGEMSGVDAAIRYYPALDIGNCCYCRSYKMRVEIEPTAEAYEFYDTNELLDAAIARMKNKIAPPTQGAAKKIRSPLIPIHARVVDWAITKEWVLENVANGNTIDMDLFGEFLSDDLGDITEANPAFQYFTIQGDHRSRLAGGDDISVRGSTANDGKYTVSAVSLNSNGEDTDVFVVGPIASSTADGKVYPMPTKILMSIDQRGDMGLGEQQQIVVYDEASAVVTPPGTIAQGSGVSDPDTWYNVVSGLDVTNLIGNNSPVKIEATDLSGTMAYGDVRFTFTVSKYSR